MFLSVIIVSKLSPPSNSICRDFKILNLILYNQLQYITQLIDNHLNMYCLASDIPVVGNARFNGFHIHLAACSEKP